ncbi:CDP-alcohol phosphatidyltransferase family protein [Novosphingobium lentum]|uniref:CDP-alcohol phosphatidyltransferase family protein n=1 Tax=Novosphingobium lentum TaxID=145287 RepID=UPI000AFE6756|nr:CDP-alcohol phosphatidyltransferase family protein [Novosphingobium lentum]
MFASGEDADRLVAGIPAAARVAHQAHLAGVATCRIVAPAPWQPQALTCTETERLAEGIAVGFGHDAAAAGVDFGPGPVLVIAGDRQPDAAALALEQPVDAPLIDAAVARILAAGDGADRRLAQTARVALRSTAKPSDGIVSRCINRPVSRSISRIMLQWPGVRPLHATYGTALIALAMVATLLTGTHWGLISGALLFQAASVFDGVDGEIARATFRASRTGARLDSLIDAATNLAFLLCVSINLQIQGKILPARLGLAGLAMLATGLLLIGRVSARSKAPFSFDIVKDYYRTGGSSGKPSGTLKGLTFLTSRDFFALFFALLIASGLALPALGLFAVSAAGWLVAVAIALRPRHA